MNTSWRTSAACRTEDPDLFFPLGSEGRWALQIEQAKNICRRCPVAETCLTEALREEGGRYDRYGIRGGLTGPERRNLRRQQTRREGRPRGTTLPPAATLAEAVERRTTPTDDGHLHWDGVSHLKFRGQRYTVLQAAFTIFHGREPVGIVRRTCGDGGCARGDHLSDEVIREAEDRCGTRSGYMRHWKRGEKACDRCLAANTDADNRLRRTGTTKQVAA